MGQSQAFRKRSVDQSQCRRRQSDSRPGDPVRLINSGRFDKNNAAADRAPVDDCGAFAALSSGTTFSTEALPYSLEMTATVSPQNCFSLARPC
jgi:hypothetical protein